MHGRSGVLRGLFCDARSEEELDVVRVEDHLRQHRGYGFDWFVVLWETSSAGLADEAEGALIDHARWKGLPLSGDRRGGVRGAGPFAVYVAGR